MATIPEHTIGREQIADVESVIRPHIRRTPVIAVDGADFGLQPTQICLKLELLQHTGSFKVRGAFANLLTRDIPPVGVVAASGGNHGAAVAYAAMTLGVPAKIFVPQITSPAKLDRMRDYGADLAAFAALSSGRYRPAAGERVGVLVCGGNTTAVDFNR
jgi:threonine dehydratase